MQKIKIAFIALINICTNQLSSVFSSSDSTTSDQWFSIFLAKDRVDYPCSRGAGEYGHPRMENRWYTCIILKDIAIVQSQYSCPSGTCYSGNTMEKCNAQSCTGNPNIPLSPRPSDVRKCDDSKLTSPQPHPWDPTRFFVCTRSTAALEIGKLYIFQGEFRCPYGTCFDQNRRSQTLCGDAATYCPQHYLVTRAPTVSNLKEKPPTMLATNAVLKHSNVVRHKFEVYYVTASPDGVERNNVLTINGHFPSPTIYAYEGNILEVELINRIQNGVGDITNVTLHWHGLHQIGTPFEDGASAITQCPIKQGSKKVYRMPLKQAGTYWYHSHFRSLYTEGLFGSLIVLPQNELYRYDKEFIISINEWYHNTARENEDWYLSPQSRGSPPFPSSVLINGMGRYDCSLASKLNRKCRPEKQLRPVFRLKEDKVVKMRIVNAGGWATFNFTVDGHTLQTVEVDGQHLAVPTESDAVHFGAGQRYGIILKRKEGATGNRFLIRAIMRREFLFQDRRVVNINPYGNQTYDEVTGVIEYGTEFEETKEVFSYNQRIPTPTVPFTQLSFLNDLMINPLDGVQTPQKVDKRITVYLAFAEDAKGIRRGSFNHKPYSPSPGKPLLFSLLKNEPFPRQNLNYDVDLGEVVELIVNNPFPGPHPIHLHGHSFWVVARGHEGDGSYDPYRHKVTINGVKRDTAMVKEKSYMVIRFFADNPGVWPLHCHIDWHAQSGMLFTFTIGADWARKMYFISEEDRLLCLDHGIEL